MKIFITGASGYLGFNLALAMRREGHEVWGLVRNDASATLLRKNEIHPVIGDMKCPESYIKVATECTILIHSAAAHGDDFFNLDKKTVDTLINLRNDVTPRTLIYTSGSWIYGEVKSEAVESSKLCPPIMLSPWPNIERQVLECQNIRGVVVRPSCVYGHQGGTTSLFFRDALVRNRLSVIGEGSNFWSMVHIDDLVRGYLDIINCGVTGEVVNLSSYSHSAFEIISEVKNLLKIEAPISSLTYEQAKRRYGKLSECFALSQIINSEKARNSIGWKPKQDSFLKNIGLHLCSWHAHQSPSIPPLPLELLMHSGSFIS